MLFLEKKSSECKKPIISPVDLFIPLLRASYMPLSGSLITIDLLKQCF